ncbi:lactadherin-like [Antedon mediterranea]|uniref:lactadherin-like n=1 Tax=Antedon mediterranea TaxID=105859 RepID=UPI003AF8BDC3
MLRSTVLVFIIYALVLGDKVASSCTNPLRVGLEANSGKISDSSFTCSSNEGGYGPSRGRLNTMADSFGRGGWMPKGGDSNSWLKVDLGQTYGIVGIITQGREDAEQWVTEYTVSYGKKDGKYFDVEDSTGSQILFVGNKDNNSEVIKKFDRKTARYVRIHPTDFHNVPCLRFELLYCDNCMFSAQVASSDCKTTKRFGLDDKIRNSNVPDSAFKSSPYEQGGYDPSRARLNTKYEGYGKQGGWMALSSDTSPWIEVDLQTDNNDLKGIITQGLACGNKWVASYNVSYKKNQSGQYNDVNNFDDSPIFTGNTDGKTEFANLFKQQITARFIRIQPMSWHGNAASLRNGQQQCS